MTRRAGLSVALSAVAAIIGTGFSALYPLISVDRCEDYGGYGIFAFDVFGRVHYVGVPDSTVPMGQSREQWARECLRESLKLKKDYRQAELFNLKKYLETRATWGW